MPTNYFNVTIVLTLLNISSPSELLNRGTANNDTFKSLTTFKSFANIIMLILYQIFWISYNRPYSLDWMVLAMASI